MIRGELNYMYPHITRFLTLMIVCLMIIQILPAAAVAEELADELPAEEAVAIMEDTSDGTAEEEPAEEPAEKRYWSLCRLLKKSRRDWRGQSHKNRLYFMRKSREWNHCWSVMTAAVKTLPAFAYFCVGGLSFLRGVRLLKFCPKPGCFSF